MKQRGNDFKSPGTPDSGPGSGSAKKKRRTSTTGPGQSSTPPAVQAPPMTDFIPPPPMSGYGESIVASNPFDDTPMMRPMPQMGNRGGPSPQMNIDMCSPPMMQHHIGPGMSPSHMGGPAPDYPFPRQMGPGPMGQGGPPGHMSHGPPPHRGMGGPNAEQIGINMGGMGPGLMSQGGPPPGHMSHGPPPPHRGIGGPGPGPEQMGMNPGSIGPGPMGPGGMMSQGGPMMGQGPMSQGPMGGPGGMMPQGNPMMVQASMSQGGPIISQGGPIMSQGGPMMGQGGPMSQSGPMGQGQMKPNPDSMGPCGPGGLPPSSQGMNGMQPGMGMGNPAWSGPSKSLPIQSGKIYPHDQALVHNPQNPNAPPIYPCGVCHKEVHDNDQAIACESGCHFFFHRGCTGLSEAAFHLLYREIYAEWVCDACLGSKNIPLVKYKP